MKPERTGNLVKRTDSRILVQLQQHNNADYYLQKVKGEITHGARRRITNYTCPTRIGVFFKNRDTILI